MVQIQHNHQFGAKDLIFSCASGQARMKEIEQKTLVLIEDGIVGDASRVEAIASQIDPKIQLEFEIIAHVIVSKALDEPQHCKACVSLAGALHLLLPALPSAHQGKKAETFMHSLLDVFQTEFEEILIEPKENTLCVEEEKLSQTCGIQSASQRSHHRIRAIVHFAGYLYGHGLLGNGVVSQMVQDLMDNGLADYANELLRFIGVVTSNPEHGNLGTVLEDADSECASSESISPPERDAIRT